MPSLNDLLTGLVESGTVNTELLVEVLEKLAEIQAKAVYHSFWIDPAAGDNTNDGLTAAAALQSPATAIARTPPGSFVECLMLGHYTMDQDLINGGRWVKARGVNALGEPAQRQWVQTVSAGAARRLICRDGAGGWLLQKLDIVPARTAISSGPTALVTGHLKMLRLLDCGIDVDGSTTVSIMGQDGISLLEVDTVTAITDALAGYWVGGVSAGVNPNTLGKVLTNLTSL